MDLIDIVLKLPYPLVSGGICRIVIVISGMNLSGFILTKADVREVECKSFCHLRWTVQQYCILPYLDVGLSHTCFPLTVRFFFFFFDETNSVYCVTVYFSVENYECSKVPLTGSKVSPGWGSFKWNTGATEMGSAFKMITPGEFANYVAIGGNTRVIVYVAICCDRLSLWVHLQYKDLKKIFKRAPAPPTDVQWRNIAH